MVSRLYEEGRVVNGFEPGEPDLHRFEGLLAEGRRVLERGRRTRGQGAAGRRGPVARPAARGPRVRAVCAHRRRAARGAGPVAREERIEAALALGRQRPLIPELEALVAEHPLRERLRAQLLLALYRSGRQADALEAYRDARSALVGQISSSVPLTRRTLMGAAESVRVRAAGRTRV